MRTKTIPVIGLLASSYFLAALPLSAHADEAWRCTKGDKVIRVFLANLQPDIAVPCEVRLERDGIIHRVAHEEVDPEQCQERADNVVETYENQGYSCESY